MLLDVNCLLAIAWPNHQHHHLVADWFEDHSNSPWFTCAVTELGFIRLSSNPAFTSEFKRPPEAVELLSQLKKIGKHRFIPSPAPDSLRELTNVSIQGHRQVTDSYLVALARSNNCLLATLDTRIKELPFSKDRLFLLS
jgi:toxin-antitoxin system PIN domain toxin